MTQEEYNRLDTDFAHCASTHCEKADKCLRHTLYKMLAGNGNETYTMVNPAVIKGHSPARSSTLTARNVLHGEYHEYMTMCEWLI